MSTPSVCSHKCSNIYHKKLNCGLKYSLCFLAQMERLFSSCVCQRPMYYSDMLQVILPFSLNCFLSSLKSIKIAYCYDKQFPFKIVLAWQVPGEDCCRQSASGLGNCH